MLHHTSLRGLGQDSLVKELCHDRHLYFLKIFDVNDGQKYFNVGSRFDIYILKNNLDNKSTEVHVKKIQLAQ